MFGTPLRFFSKILNRGKDMYRVRNDDTGELLEPEFTTEAAAKSFAENILGMTNFSVIPA